MQVNSCQPSFKAGKIYYSAEMAMRRRMSPRKFAILRDYFNKMYKDSKFDVALGTTTFDGTQLEATIRYNGIFMRYEAESLMSNIFCSPFRFIKKVKGIVKNELMPRLS